MASLRANKRLKAFFDRLVANHKPKKVALVAVMKKLLHFMNANIVKNWVWNENFAWFSLQILRKKVGKDKLRRKSEEGDGNKE